MAPEVIMETEHTYKVCGGGGGGNGVGFTFSEIKYAEWSSNSARGRISIFSNEFSWDACDLHAIIFTSQWLWVFFFVLCCFAPEIIIALKALKSSLQLFQNHTLAGVLFERSQRMLRKRKKVGQILVYFSVIRFSLLFSWYQWYVRYVSYVFWPRFFVFRGKRTNNSAELQKNAACCRWDLRSKQAIPKIRRLVFSQVGKKPVSRSSATLLNWKLYRSSHILSSLFRFLILLLFY